MVARHAHGELLWHACDAKMLSDGMARLQILSQSYMAGCGGKRMLGWRIVDEKEYRRRNHKEEYWEVDTDPA